MKRASYEKTYNSHYHRRAEGRPFQFWVHFDPVENKYSLAMKKGSMGAQPSKNPHLLAQIS